MRVEADEDGNVALVIQRDVEPRGVVEMMRRDLGLSRSRWHSSGHLARVSDLHLPASIG